MKRNSTAEYRQVEKLCCCNESLDYPQNEAWGQSSFLHGGSLLFTSKELITQIKLEIFTLCVKKLKELEK